MPDSSNFEMTVREQMQDPEYRALRDRFWTQRPHYIVIEKPTRAQPPSDVPLTRAMQQLRKQRREGRVA